MEKRVKLFITKVVWLAFSIVIVLSSIASIERGEVLWIQGALLVFAVVFICYLVFINVDEEAKGITDNLQQLEDEEREMFEKKREIRVEPLEDSEEMENIKENFNFIANLQGDKVIIYSIRRRPENVYHKPYEYDELRVGQLRKYYRIL